MDFLKEAKEQFSSGSNNAQQPAQDGQVQNNNNAGAEDYGDKGLDFIEKKTGYTQDRNTNEKITDGARDLFEKATGKTVDPKWSN